MTLRGLNNWGAPGRCERCGVDALAGPDPCLGVLAGVREACCGHGRMRDAYVVLLEPRWPDRALLRGQAALRYFQRIGVGP